MRRVFCLVATMCVISCHGENPESVLTVVQHHEPDRVVDTKLGTLTFADQSWGVQQHVEDDGQPLEMFYRAEVSFELAEEAEGLEVWVPYKIHMTYSSKTAQEEGMSATKGFHPPRVILTPDAAPWTEARATIDFARPVHDPLAYARMLDSLSINRDPLLLPAGTMKRAYDSFQETFQLHLLRLQ